jgi:hypothetical protein
VIHASYLCYHPPRCISASGTTDSLAFSQDLIGYGIEEIDAARGYSEHTTDRRSGGLPAWLLCAYHVIA